MKQQLAILGATGSVGVSTLDVVARHPDRFEVFALTAHSRIAELEAQCLRWKPRFAVLGEAPAAAELQRRLRAHGLGTEVLSGAQALCEMAAHEDVTSVMAAIVGAAGLAPCLAAARAGKRILLANKEALVVGGALFMNAVREGGATLLPIDSEHSAIFQCLPEDRATWPARIDHIVLTGSGGPFRSRDPATLHHVTPDEAVAHPNWVTRPDRPRETQASLGDTPRSDPAPHNKPRPPMAGRRPARWRCRNSILNWWRKPGRSSGRRAA